MVSKDTIECVQKPERQIVEVANQEKQEEPVFDDFLFDDLDETSFFIQNFVESSDIWFYDHRRESRDYYR